MVDLNRYVWVSDNGKWAIKNVETKDGLTIANVHDLALRKGFEVIVEHIKEGQKLLYNEIADKTYDNVISDRPIPKYLQNKIIEFKMQ